MTQSSTFTYWKKPWHKWCCLIAALCQLGAMALGAADYRRVSAVQAQLFTPSAWRDYQAQHLSQMGFSALCAVLFLGTLVLGALVRSRRAADLGEGLLLLGIAGLGAVIALGVPAIGQYRPLWLAISALSLAAGAHSLWRSRSKPQP